jgi:hypothetical protein
MKVSTVLVMARILASRASLLISTQELLYAAKVDLTFSLLATLMLQILTCFIAPKFPDFPSMNPIMKYTLSG